MPIAGIALGQAHPKEGFVGGGVVAHCYVVVGDLLRKFNAGPLVFRLATTLPRASSARVTTTIQETDSGSTRRKSRHPSHAQAFRCNLCSRRSRECVTCKINNKTSGEITSDSVRSEPTLHEF